MNQPSLPFERRSVFDPEEGEVQRDNAIKQVEDHADQTWKLRAMDAIRQVASQQAYFQGDEIWNLIEKPREPRALGAIFKRAQSMKWIEPTESWKPSRISTQHRQPIRVWKSLLFTHRMA